MAMCLAGIPTIVKLMAGMAKLAAAVPWHCAQLVVVDGALAWISATVGITEKSVLVWHEVQVALAAYGMWLLGVAVALKFRVLAWQFEQSPGAAGCAASLMP
jgi:hypothetical protein